MKLININIYIIIYILYYLFFNQYIIIILTNILTLHTIFVYSVLDWKSRGGPFCFWSN